MPNARHLASVFRSGDLPFRPRSISQFWVVKTASRSPVLATQVYGELIRSGGTSHAAEMFLTLLERMCTSASGEFIVWWHLVAKNRKEVPLPG